jgi:hypothetical protein
MKLGGTLGNVSQKLTTKNCYEKLYVFRSVSEFSRVQFTIDKAQ